MKIEKSTLWLGSFRATSEGLLNDGQFDNLDSSSKSFVGEFDA